MKLGRPTKYDDTILERTKEYLENYEEHDDVFPSIVGLACVLRVNRQTIYNWADANPDFFDILEDIRQQGERVLVKNGLKSEFNSNITKLVLGKFGYHEKVDNNTSMNVNIGGKDAKTL